MRQIFRYLKNPIFFLISIVFVIPCILLALQSFALGWRWPAIFPQTLSLSAWKVVFGEERIISAIGTTFLIGIIVVVINLVMALPAGKALAHYNFRGKTLIETFFLLPLLIPTLAIAMGIQIVMLRAGLTDHLPGVVLVHLIPTLPYSIRIFRAAFESLGLKWEEQARTLGIKPFVIFYTVWLPLLIPSIQSASMLVFIISLSQYALTAIIGGGTVTTLSMLYFPYFEGSNRAVTAAFSIVFAALPVCFLVLMKILLRLLVPYSRRYSGG